MTTWDGRERRKDRGLTDEQKREILEIFEQQVGRGTLKAIGSICRAVCLAGAGYLAAHIEKWWPR